MHLLMSSMVAHHIHCTASRGYIWNSKAGHVLYKSWAHHRLSCLCCEDGRRPGTRTSETCSSGGRQRSYPPLPEHLPCSNWAPASPQLGKCRRNAGGQVPSSFQFETLVTECQLAEECWIKWQLSHVISMLKGLRYVRQSGKIHADITLQVNSLASATRKGRISVVQCKRPIHNVQPSIEGRGVL